MSMHPQIRHQKQKKAYAQVQIGGLMSLLILLQITLVSPASPKTL